MDRMGLSSSFTCDHCGSTVRIHPHMGTGNRNHCPFCLFSKHVDQDTPGDRNALCMGPMTPIGLTFKHEGKNKYGQTRQGELMIIHECRTCGKTNINRIAADDNETVILSLLDIHPETVTAVSRQGITPIGKDQEAEVRKQLFGAVR